MVDVLVEKIGASFGELQEHGDGFTFWDMAILFEVGLEVAKSSRAYPPEQYSKKK